MFDYICGKRISEIDYTIKDVVNAEIHAHTKKVTTHAIYVFICIATQIQNATSEDNLKEFDHASVLADAGYTKPINLVSMENRNHLLHALLMYFGLLIIKVELDQFKVGLLNGMLLIQIQKNSDIFIPVFTSDGEHPLTAGWFCIPNMGKLWSIVTNEANWH